MAQTPEGRVKNAIKKYLKTVPDCWFFMPIGGPYSAHGIPDIVGMVRGRLFAIECKAPGKEKNTTENQKRVIREMRLCGGVVFVASSVDVVETVFELWNLTGTVDDTRGEDAASPDVSGEGAAGPA